MLPLFESKERGGFHDFEVLQSNDVLEAEKDLAPEKMVRFKWYYRGSHFWICSMSSMLFGASVHDAGKPPKNIGR